MYNYDEDFYNEPSVFEQQIDEFKQSLLNVVKADYIAEMEKLRVENAELQEVKKNYSQIQQDYKNKEYQLQNERNEMTRNVRRERLSVLMKDFETLMYKTDYDNVLLPKCDNCDENRKIYFKTPSGKETHETCVCHKTKRVYSPKEFICSEFKIDRDNNSMIMWYKMNPERDYDYASHSSSTVAKSIYKEGMQFEDLDSYNTFFVSKVECQKYCKWLTKKASKDTSNDECYAPYEEEDSE